MTSVVFRNYVCYKNIEQCDCVGLENLLSLTLYLSKQFQEQFGIGYIPAS